jgi:two-component system sensor histidine kinase BaeS
MRLTTRLILLVALTALFSVTLTGALSLQAIRDRVPRAIGAVEGSRGAPVGGQHYESRPPMSNASRTLIAELQGATARAAAIALVLGSLAGGVVALSTLAPLQRLAEGMRRYGAGERGSRVQVVGRDEIATLASVFNDTAEALELELAQRQRFTNDIAHELRTPLTVLKSELEAMEDGLMHLDAHHLAGLLGQVNLLTRLVGDLRLLSSAEAGELTWHPERIDLVPLLQRVVRSFTPFVASRGIHLSLHSAAGNGPCWAWVDAERLQQVCNALLDNAWRHAPDGDRVEVSLACTEESATLVVRDHGAGFAPTDLPLVFQRLYRGDHARSRAGSGLGLSIVSALIALQGGRVEAANHTEGGAQVTVILPTQAPELRG